MVASAELLERLSARYPGLQRAEDELNDTARTWQIPGYKGSLGFISSMSDHFCSSCNRLRITADGQIKVITLHLSPNIKLIPVIKVCLFDPLEVSLRDKMREGASDEQLLQVIRQAIFGKKEKHAGMENIDVITNRPMILIGG